MGKAIAFFAILALCGFAFVIGHLLLRRPAASTQHPGSLSEAGAALENREDGSVYAIGLKIEGFERRLVEGEERNRRQAAEIATLRLQQADAAKKREELETDLRRLRKQVNELPKPEPPPTDASMPPTSGPVSTPVVPQPEGGP